MEAKKDDDILIVKHKQDRLKVKVVKAAKNNWSPTRYEKIIKGKDFNILAFLFYDMRNMGYDIEKAYGKYKSLMNEPDLFFL